LEKDESDENGGNTIVVDIQDMFFRFTIDIFTSVAFGVELHSFARDEQHPFAKGERRIKLFKV
jgi:hypothetical protein